MKVLLQFVAIALVSASAGAATVREAHVSIALTPAACDVVMRLAVDTAEPAVIDHTLLLDDAVHAPEFSVVGAVGGTASTVGRTERFPISLTGTGRNEYTVRYRVIGRSLLDRCPLLVPSAPTDGLARTVEISVASPPGATRLPGEFPAFTWNGARGTVTLGHFPSFVRVPLARPGAAHTWRDSLDPRRVIDAFAIVAIGVGTLAWAVYRKARG